MAEITRDTIIEAAKRIAADSGATPTKTDFVRLSGIGEYHIYRLFPEGGWSEVRKLTGIDRHPMDLDPVTDDQLMAEFYRVAKELGKIPTWSVFASRARFSDTTIRRRFGGLEGTLRHLRDWLVTHEPESPLLEELKTKSRHEISNSAGGCESPTWGLSAFGQKEPALSSAGLSTFVVSAMCRSTSKESFSCLAW
jgi:hypothetical protein